MRHPDCDAAVTTRAAVLTLVRRALQSVHNVVTEGDSAATNGSTSPASALNGDSGISLSAHQAILSRTAKDFQV